MNELKGNYPVQLLSETLSIARSSYYYEPQVVDERDLVAAVERAHGVTISLSDTGQPTQNGIAERFIRTLKEEHVDYSDYDDFDDAQHQLGHWLMVVYNTQRIHSALDYLTPAEFEVHALAQNPYPPLN
jgi:transposase InsO family protein